MIKRGTKKKRNGQWEKRVVVYMSQELYEKLQDIARLTNMKESAYMRNLLTMKLENLP